MTNGMTTVQRHATIPLTQRDSLISTGSRVTLVHKGGTLNRPATTAPHGPGTAPRVLGSAAGGQPLQQKDFVNTNPNMIAGKKRSPKKVKRTPSYRKATDRQSAFDGLDSNDSDCEHRNSRLVSGRVSKQEDRKKYNTLPIKPGQKVTLVEPQKGRRKKDNDRGDGDRSTTKSGSHTIGRSWSQKSGTYYPSPDTDDDQRTTKVDRKKKSKFRKMKERLMHTFRIDSDREREKKNKKQLQGAFIRSHGSSRVLPSNDNARVGFKSTANGAGIEDRTGVVDSHSASQAHHQLELRHDSVGRRETARRDEMESNNHGDTQKPSLFQSIRQSFRRKRSPQIPRKQKHVDSRHSVDSVIDEHPAEQNNHLGLPPNPAARGVVTNAHVTPSNHVTHSDHVTHSGHVSHSDHVTYSDHVSLSRVNHGGNSTSNTQTTTTQPDPITELFGTLIEPEFGIHLRRQRSSSAGQRPETPDRSKLRLSGLRKCRPSSFENRHVRTGAENGDEADGPIRPDERTTNLSPTVDIDGFDYADAPPVAGFIEEDGAYADVSPEEQQRRIDAVGNRLAAIGDRIASERRETGSSSEIEGHRVGGQTSSDFDEKQLLKDLQEFADDFDANMFKKCRPNISVDILPIVKNILMAQDYSGFKKTITREISDTVGWDQVAWYTYVVKTAMYVAGTGSAVRRYATQYFTSSLRPWIETRPKGWESIHEDTDDDELD